MSGSKSADAVVVVVERIRLGRHQAKISAICTDTCVVGKPFGVVADTDLAVGLVKVSGRSREVRFRDRAQIPSVESR